MSLIAIRVELPAYSHSFTVQVPPSSSISDVKHAITKSCTGAPRSEGQRLIYKGRFLRDDEKLQDIWKSPDDSRVLHLAVHPSAWSSEPPDSLSPPSSVPISAHYPSLGQRQGGGAAPPAAISPPVSSPLLFVILKHNAALSALMSGVMPAPVPRELRQPAVAWIQSRGWQWPDLLDEEFPPAGAPEEGVRYASVTINNMSYAQLATPSATPSPLQVHAFKVLSITYTILANALASPDLPSSNFAPYPSYYYPPYAAPAPYGVPVDATHLNHHLQQLGMPPLRAAPELGINGDAPPPEIRAIPLRALLVPLVMLVFRTLLVMYFFSPSKRPWFGLIISAWILYEAWGALRVVLGEERRGAFGEPQEGNGAAAGAGAAAGQANAQAAPGRPPPRARTASRGLVSSAVDTLATMDLGAEDAALDAARPASEPSFMHKAKTFIVLFFVTLYPAAWDRRRVVLRRREGRIRTEASTRAQDADEGEDEARAQARTELKAKHERRPAWIRAYVERVETTEWADDA